MAVPEQLALTSQDVKQSTPGMRALLWVAGGLVFLAGMQLFVFPERTATYFAWTIDFPLTAAFLGAAYWASVVFEWVAARQQVWANARISVPTVFAFTTLTLVATLIHLELFHLGSEFEPATRAVTWAWIAIYGMVPLLMAWLWMRQARAPGGDPPHGRRLQPWIRGVLLLHALVMIAVGGALFIAPGSTAGLWPWPLTPLTGRAVGAWVLSLGIAAAHSRFENDRRRLRAAALSYVALGVLQTAAALRFAGDVEWTTPNGLAYIAMLASIVGVGTAALASGNRR